MTNSPGDSIRYPLLESLLRQRGLNLKGIYTILDAAEIFGVSTRTLQDWVRDCKLVARELPGRGRFLSEDLELVLERSTRRREKPGEEVDASDENFRPRGSIPATRRERRQYGK